MTRASAAASSPRSPSTFRRASDLRGIRLGTARPQSAAPRASSSASVAGNEWNQPGNAIPFALRPQTGEGPLNSITNFYSIPVDFPSTAPGGGLFPYTYTASKPIFISGPGGATEAISPHFKYPYVYQFNFSMQRQLPAGITLTTAYVGALSHQLPNFIDANYAPYSTAFGTPSTSAHQHCRPASVRSLRRSLPHGCGSHQQWHRSSGSIRSSTPLEPDSQLSLAADFGVQAAFAQLQRERFLCLEPRA